MKKILSLLLCLSMILSLYPFGNVSAAAAGEDTLFPGGSGTADDPYLVSTPEQLMAVSNGSGLYFLQTNDIDLSSVSFRSPSIGAGSVYDGGGNCVTGLQGDAGTAALFSSNSGTIRNLGLEDSTIQFSHDRQYVSSNGYTGTVGGLVASNSGLIQSCYVKDTQVSGYVREHTTTSYSTVVVRAGGLVGWNAEGGQILGCSFSGSVQAEGMAAATRPNYLSSTQYAGGIVGWNEGSVSGCYSTASVAATGDRGGTNLTDGGVTNYTGTLCARSDEGTLSQCYSLSGDQPPVGLGESEGVTSMTAEELAGSDFLQLLNSQGYTVWTQGDDGLPTLTARDLSVQATPSSGTYDMLTPIQVSLTPSPAGAQLQYALGGTAAGLVPYEGPISLSEDTALLVSISSADQPQVTRTQLFTYLAVRHPVQGSPSPGTYSTPQRITLSHPVAGAEIFYTIDGSDPIENGIRYTPGSTVNLRGSTVITAVAKVGEEYIGPTQLSYLISPVITATPAAGPCQAPIQVELECAVNGYQVYYTLDGSDPTLPGTGILYDGTPISIYQTTQLKAAPCLDGMWGKVTTFDYTFPQAVITPSPDPGPYADIQQVSLTCPVPSYQIYYTLDGSDPAEAGIPYTQPFQLDHSAALRVCAKYEGNLVASQQFDYTLTGLVTVQADQPSGDYKAPLTITLTPSDDTYQIYYTTDGSDPKVSGLPYTGPITLEDPVPTRLRAVAALTVGGYTYYGTEAVYQYTFPTQFLRIEDHQLTKRAGYEVTFQVTNTLPEEQTLTFVLAASAGDRMWAVGSYTGTFPTDEQAKEVVFSCFASAPLPEGTVFRLFTLDGDTLAPRLDPVEWDLADVPVIQELSSLSAEVTAIQAYEGETLPVPVITAHYTNGKPDKVLSVGAVDYETPYLAPVTYYAYSDTLLCEEPGQTTLTCTYDEGGITQSLSIPVTVLPTSYDRGFLADPTADTLPQGAIPISTAAQLAAIGGEDSAGKTYYLTRDIQLTGEWEPIYNFQGTFDGRGHTVKGLYISSTSGCPQAGLFSSAFHATIRNLAVEIASQGVTALHYDESIATYAGGLVAYASAVSLENCSVTGGPVTATGNNASAGGLAGYVTYQTRSQKVENCFATCDVTANSHLDTAAHITYAGGLIGYFAGNTASMTRCYSAGQVTAVYQVKATGGQTGIIAGGLIGKATQATVTNCFSLANAAARHTVNSTAALVAGGLIGMTSSVTVSTSYAGGSAYVYNPKSDFGSNTCLGCVGGLLGSASGKVTDCYRADTGVSYIGSIELRLNQDGTPINVDSTGLESFYPGFDFSAVWQVDRACFQAKPHLRYQGS